MKKFSLRRYLHQQVRNLFSLLPRPIRFRVFRSMVDCDPAPDPRLTFKIADTKEELEACFRILHDAYVGSGFMKPDPSGMRVTIYHALPTTTTLCAKWDGQVVGTVSIIREGVFGFPLQSAFDLAPVREKEGSIAEISALAVHPSFRKTGGIVLFPMMKYLYEYCVKYFDTRHMVIAVNPDRIDLYESLLAFRRLQAQVVDRYDFANGAPAVGATLDLHYFPEALDRTFGGKPVRKNLHEFFIRLCLPNFAIPRRRYHTTNDPVMTPELLDHFFNRATHVFATLDERKKRLLHSIYHEREYQRVLPPLVINGRLPHPLRQHQRFSLKCPGLFEVRGSDGRPVGLQVIEVSLQGFKARADRPIALQETGVAKIELGSEERSMFDAQAVRVETSEVASFYGFRIVAPDAAWRRCVLALEHGQTHVDLAAA
ncbi:MAG: GNAT family N-acetyltransferase [Proteobacteria bacterium]|nr:GNAT family N-acetyltransferase [Pseudomonadota bacterium]